MGGGGRFLDCNATWCERRDTGVQTAVLAPQYSVLRWSRHLPQRGSESHASVGRHSICLTMRKTLARLSCVSLMMSAILFPLVRKSTTCCFF